MSKKVKCIECHNSMHWEIPDKVPDKNYEYAKHCLQTAKRSIVCGNTMRTKSINHEQYCKKFSEKTDFDFQADSYYQKKIEKLEKMIK